MMGCDGSRSGVSCLTPTFSWHSASPARLCPEGVLLVAKTVGRMLPATGAYPQGGTIGKPVKSGAAPATVVEC